MPRRSSYWPCRRDGSARERARAARHRRRRARGQRPHPRDGLRVQQHRSAARRRDDPRSGASAPAHDHRARRNLRPRGSRPRDRDAVHHRGRVPLDLSADLPDRRRGPSTASTSRRRRRASTARWLRCSACRWAPAARCASARSCPRSARATSATSASAEFTGYGAHGVAGATAFATPALAAPIYFNRQVVPDPAQRRSSVDGGVIWPRVPTGVYTIRARHRSTRFASFVATCAPGRVVNANPPWGLHQLGKPMPATVSARWSVRGASVRLRALRLARLPAGASVRVRCRGRALPL